jgi:hypothetical protein
MIILSFGRYLASSQCEQEVIIYLTQSLACFQFTLRNPICKPQPMGKPKWMATLECSPPLIHIFTRVFPTICSYHKSVPHHWFISSLECSPPFYSYIQKSSPPPFIHIITRVFPTIYSYLCKSVPHHLFISSQECSPRPIYITRGIGKTKSGTITLHVNLPNVYIVWIFFSLKLQQNPSFLTTNVHPVLEVHLFHQS